MARAQLPKIFPKPHSLFLHGGFFAGAQTPLRENDSALPPQGFSLTIDPENGIRIRAADDAGAHYAELALAQIRAQAEESGLPCLTLEDAPDFPVRGFMLDVSRGRVPVMRELFALVDLLSELRYNQLQLYVEHTFAFQKHENVWRDASPLTPGEIRELDAYCAKKYIELVPNLNSFGHVERWLEHAEYKPLAECPGGFFHEVFKMQRAAGTFRACAETADFMGELYREYLPNFSSEKFNIGGDEPWELGQGRSRADCESRGKKAVYLEHMARLRKRAEACGKRVLFWADVLLGDDSAPAEANAEEFFSGTPAPIPLIWGYEKGHPFGEQCARVSARSKEFYVVSGTSAWLTLTGRLDNALANISESAAAGFKHGASGILLTTWGDFGYHNPFCANLLPILACAAQSWNFLASQSPDLLYGFEAVRLGSRELAAALFYAGRIDNFISKKITNRSFVRELFFAKKSAFPQLMESVPADEIAAAKREVERIFAAFPKMEIPGDGARDSENFARFREAIFPELALALEMSHIALCRAEAFLKNDFETLAAIEKEISGALAEKFSAVWRLRDREGGLSASLAYFDVAGTAPHSS